MAPTTKTLTIEAFQRMDAEKLLAEIKTTKEPLTLTTENLAVVLVDLESYRELVGELAKVKALAQFDQAIADLNA